MLGDLRYALRIFARRPSFAAAAIATLALGIAVNTIAFSLLNSLVLRSMPIRDAGRVVRLYPVEPSARRGTHFSLADYQDYRAASTAIFETLAAYIPADLTAGRSSLDRSPAAPRAALGYVVSANYFDLTGVRAALGRVLQAEDDIGGARAIVLSHDFWQSRFGGSAAIVGSSLAINGQPFTVVGVAEAGFAGTEPIVADLWIPAPALAIAVPGSPPPGNRDGSSFLVAGRMAKGVSAARVAGTMNTIASRLAIAYPGASRPIGVEVASGTFFTLDPAARPVIAGVMAVVGLVLLIACANVANLMLVRAASRQREIAVRLAIGAARGRIIRQLTVETLALGVAAGGTALLIAEWTLRLLYRAGVALAPFSWTVALNLEPDVRVFAYTLVLAVGGGLLLGLAPALQASSPDLARALHVDGAMTSRLRGTRLRHALVIVQVAASLVLLVAAGLLLRGLQSARALDLGFRTAGVIYADYDLEAAGYPAARAAAFNDALEARARSLPGVRAVAFTSHVPLHGGVRRVALRLPDRPSVPPITTTITTISRDYFEILAMPIVTGRGFDASDLRGSTAAVVIGDGLARRFWPGEPAIGKTIAAAGWPGPRTVVGVVRDAANAAIWRDKEMAVYVPRQPATDPRAVRLILHTSADVPATARAIAAAAAALDGDLRFEATPLDRLLRLWILPSRVTAAAAAVLAILALALACIGIYGVLSFTVSQRLREIGVRMALGADARTVVALVLRDGWRLIAKGLAIGAACALAVAPLLGRLLFEVSAFDPLTLAAVPLMLAAIALGACYIPARRASRLEPLSVLRSD